MRHDLNATFRSEQFTMIERARLIVLVSLVSAALASLGFAIVNTLRDQDQSFAFPYRVPLKDAQLLHSHPLPTQVPNPYSKSLASHLYQYRFQSTPLEIQMIYASGTGGDLQRFLNNYALTAIPQHYQPQGAHRQNPDLGFYQIYSYQDRTYLSACIDPGGKTTVTTAQFIRHWNSHWYLLGQDYMDDRCLWTHLSVPVGQNSPRQTEQLLESAWFSWYQWWRTRFPPQQA